MIQEDGPSAVAFWNGNEAGEALRWLDQNSVRPFIVSGTYGKDPSDQADCDVIVCGPWYAIRGSRNVNRAADPSVLVPGVDTETVADCDGFNVGSAVEDIPGLIRTLW